MKKIRLMALVLCFVLLCGCTAPAPVETTPSTEATQPTQTEPTQTEPTGYVS